MNQESFQSRNRELRKEVRSAASQGASIEFKPGREAMTYHFRLRDISPSGLGILAPENSSVFGHIRVGDRLYMQFHASDATRSPEHLKVEIRHISAPDGGRPRGHLIIGLYVLERIDEADAPKPRLW